MTTRLATRAPVMPTELHLELGLDSADTGKSWQLANVAPPAANDLDPFTSIMVSIYRYAYMSSRLSVQATGLYTLPRAWNTTYRWLQWVGINSPLVSKPVPGKPSNHV
jgi:hypothetical protein